MSKTIWVLNGPNMNLLGEREPEKYGTMTLAQLDDSLLKAGTLINLMVHFYQNNHEGALIDQIHKIRHEAHGMIINPGAFGHTSIALRDALAAFPHPIIEVHLTNVFKREEYRHHSFVSEVAVGVISGMGTYGYHLALKAMAQHLSTDSPFCFYET